MAYVHDGPNERQNKAYIPIDCAAIAEDLGVDGDIVFGRLYYYLDKRYGYKNDDGTLVRLFTLSAGQDRHCVHFPLLASVLAEMREQNTKYAAATMISVIALLISLFTLLN